MDTRIWNILGNHIKGESSPDEQTVLSEWLDESAENAQILEDVKTIWEKTGSLDTYPHAPKVDVDQEWEAFKNFRATNEQSDNSQVTSPPKEGKHLILPSWTYRVAAAILLGFGLIYFINYSGGLKLETEVIVYNTLEQKKKILLPDGSEIWLNKKSELSYDTDFGTSHRTVALSGEAFFDIKKDPTPFVIHGHQSRTEVLGTAFNLRSYATEPKTELALIRGSVAFSEKENPDNKVILAPGETATLETKSRKINKSKNSNINVLSWKKDELVFNKSKLGDVAKSLENHFNVQVNFTNEQLLTCHFTGTFKDPELHTILAVLAASLKLEYSVSDKVVTLSGEGCMAN